MSEQLHTPSHQELPSPEIHASHERREHLHRLETEGRTQERELRTTSERARDTIEQEAISGAEFGRTEHHKQPAAHQHSTVSRELRAMTFKRALVRLQKRQIPTDRILSKFMHLGAVDAASETIGKTIARPSGIIGGGLLSLIGTTVLLLTARHYGFTYNYFVFFCLFAIGLLLGQIAEIAWKLFRRRSQ